MVVPGLFLVFSMALFFFYCQVTIQRQCYSREERLLTFYFRLVLVSQIVRHGLRLREKPSVIGLAAILQYFAHVVSGRMNSVHLGNLSASDHQLRI